MKRFLKFRYGEKGFTLIELLIVVAILGILAAVIVPNLAGFIGTGKVAAANTEVANVETAALAFYADGADADPTDANGEWPDNTTTDLLGYLSDAAKSYNYGFDKWGKVDMDNGVSWTDPAVVWDKANHKWIKASG